MQIKIDEVRRLRREKDFSQEYVAEMIGLSQSQYSRIESGECSLDFDKTKKISEILGINPLDIIDFKDGHSFVNCSQSGNIGEINNLDFEKERQTLLKMIEELKADKEFLKQENLSLKNLLESLITK